MQAEVDNRAATVAADAAQKAGIEIVEVGDLEGLRAASMLVAEIWETAPDDSQLPPELLRALTHAGNYAAGAFSDGELVGVVIGFLGQDDDGPYLHSHILGVSPRRRGGNIGFALKQHQRAWSLRHGLSKITWTFDPLVGRNAHFNLQKLGAHADAYYESFYGQMRDGINVGDESDRLLVVWRLDDPKAVDASCGELNEPTLDGAACILSASPDGEPRRASGQGKTLLCGTPDNIVKLRRSDPDAALRWRFALRETLGAALHDGYAVTGFARSGWYVLQRDGSRA